MCGITGIIDFSRTDYREPLKKMAATLFHRGPDDEGIECMLMDEAFVGFGFRRLSIIDLSSLGHQPMINENNGDVIVFNGEVYNFKEIREELILLGYVFKSNTDTEVVLKSYQAWGTKCVDKFIGMFAITLFDNRNRKIVAFRDRAGVKPYYYYFKNGLFLFGSELKCFHEHPGFQKEIDFDATSLLFLNGYISAPYTIFKNTFKLEPGCLLELDLKTRELTTTPYWSITEIFNRPKIKIHKEDAEAWLESLLHSAFNYRLISDVPVGVFLSGGYDSTCVTALLQANLSTRLKTFTIGFENKDFDESPYAKAVAQHLGTDHAEFICSEQQAIDIVPILPDIYDEPMADGAAIPNILVSSVASKEVSVALSADGGDEIFAGYSKYFYCFTDIHKYMKIPPGVKNLASKSIGILNHIRSHPSNSIDRLDRFKGFLEAKDEVVIFSRINQAFTDEEVRRLVRKKFGFPKTAFDDGGMFNDENDLIQKIIATDFKTFLPDDILHKVDRSSMAVSLEAREPLLDHRIVEFAATLPSSLKARDMQGKYLLKRIVHKYVPEKLVNRPKMGFGIPIHIWGLDKMRHLMEDYFRKDYLKKQGIFDPDKVADLYKGYLDGNLILFDRVWVIYTFQAWYRRWME